MTRLRWLPNLLSITSEHVVLAEWHSAACCYLQDLLLQLSPDALDWAEWVGLLLPPPADPSGSRGSSSTAGEVESLLRIKCLLLAAVALKLRAFRWVTIERGTLRLPVPRNMRPALVLVGLAVNCLAANCLIECMQVAGQAS
jgi:hypothetical protein